MSVFSLGQFFTVRVIFRACSGHRHQTHTDFPGHPPTPLLQEGHSRGGLGGWDPSGKVCVGQMGKEAECGGMAPMEEWTSVVLRERS